MRTSGEVYRKFKQALFRHRKKAIEQVLHLLPADCAPELQQQVVEAVKLRFQQLPGLDPADLARDYPDLAALSWVLNDQNLADSVEDLLDEQPVPAQEAVVRVEPLGWWAALRAFLRAVRIASFLRR